MSYSIGPKIGIDGEAEFRKQIRAINDEYKALEAETRALSSVMAEQGDEQQKLTSGARQLEKQLETQRKKLSLLQDAVDKASKLYGENSIEATRLRGALYDTQATISNLESELQDTTRRLDDVSEGLENVGDEAQDAEKDILDFSDVLNANLVADLAVDALQELGDAVADFAKGMPEAAAEVQAAASQFEQTFGGMESTAQRTLDGIAEDTGIAATRMQESFTSIFAFSKTMGADSAQALDLSSRAMAAAADSAAYYDKSIEDVTETIQSFLKGNYENDAALGISATETTRNTAANELYAKSFNELTEAQKVDVLLSMVEAGNAASGALGQAAREADSWANVTGELDEAMYQLQATLGNPVLEALISVIQGITSGIYDLLEVSDWKVLDNSINSLESSMAAAGEQSTKTTAQVDGSAYAAQQYAKRLGELETAGLDSADAQEEYKRIVEQINSLVPDLNLSIDEQTGLVDQDTESILANVEAWKKQAYAQAIQEKLTAQVKAYGEAEASLYDAKFQLSSLETEEGEILRQLCEQTGLTEEQIRSYIGTVESTTSAYQSSSYGAAALAQETSDLAQQTNLQSGANGELFRKLVQNNSEQERLNAVIGQGTRALEEAEKAIDDTTAATQKYTLATDDASGSQEDLQASAEETQAQLQVLTEAYALAQEEARGSIDSQIGLFEELSMESSMTAQEIIANWQSQQAAFANYEENLKKAVDMGLDEALVKQLADGSEQSMVILNELVNSTDTSVGEINAVFRDRLNAEDSLVEELADINAAADGLASDLYDEMYESGKCASEGLADGMDDYAYLVEESSKRMAGFPKQVYNTTNEIYSPSRVMNRSGRDTVLGVVGGIDENAKRLEESMSNLAVSGRDAYLEERLDAVEQFPVVYDLPVVSSGATSTKTTNYGGISLNIYQQPGEDAQDLAYRVMDIIQTEVAREEVAF